MTYRFIFKLNLNCLLRTNSSIWKSRIKSYTYFVSWCIWAYCFLEVVISLYSCHYYLFPLVFGSGFTLPGKMYLYVKKKNCQFVIFFKEMSICSNMGKSFWCFVWTLYTLKYDLPSNSVKCAPFDFVILVLYTTLKMNISFKCWCKCKC